MRSSLLTAAAVLFAQLGLAQLPDMYKTVDRVTWVVKDLRPVIAGWEKVDAAVDDYGIIEHRATFRGKSVTVRARVAAARIGSLHVEWVQPLDGENAFTEFLAKHGDGVFSLVHRAPSIEALEQEVVRLHSAGVDVLQRGTIESEDGAVTYVQFDTEPQGKYSLGVLFEPPYAESDLPDAAGLSKVTQYAFVVRDVRAVSGYWHKLGFPEMDYTHPPLFNLVYHGKPGRFDQELGWQRHGSVVYEWIQPLKGPTVYEDQIQAHGEGFHHFALDIPDMDKAVSKWKTDGYAAVQSGDWGDKGKSGWGRFSYIDTEPAGGVTVELLWNYKPAGGR